MWLLSTKTLKFVPYNGPEAIPGGYAILSHVWRAAEQSFQDIQREDASVSSKIREACGVAQAHGFAWLWLDTCCIDKSSSSELSEAINSMFRWYAHARICYAYLSDVPASCILHAPSSDFRSSRWFTRGWTLQELIAPRYLIFLSSDWTPIGSKAALAELIEEVTGVDVEVLTFARRLSDVTVARRMSWASRRQTTRVEDEAYSLMGLFDVHMPTIYGEGRAAFRRLQEEILRQIDDHTLFAWGEFFAQPTANTRGVLLTDMDEHNGCLFAQSPAAFAGWRSASASPVQQWKPSIWTWSEFTVTTIGVRSRMPVAGTEHIAVAMLDYRDATTGHQVGLLLSLDPNASDRRRLRPTYRVGVSVAASDGLGSYYHTYRLLRIKGGVMNILRRIESYWPYSQATSSLRPSWHKENDLAAAPTLRFQELEIYLTCYSSAALPSKFIKE